MLHGCVLVTIHALMAAVLRAYLSTRLLLLVVAHMWAPVA
jgi:hypothetical protein